MKLGPAQIPLISKTSPIVFKKYNRNVTPKTKVEKPKKGGLDFKA